MPLVVFDRSAIASVRQRFYDRAFSFKIFNRSSPPLLIGLAHECQLADGLPNEGLDKIGCGRNRRENIPPRYCVAFHTALSLSLASLSLLQGKSASVGAAVPEQALGNAVGKHTHHEYRETTNTMSGFYSSVLSGTDFR